MKHLYVVQGDVYTLTSSLYLYAIFFFFSSRRRHTRLQGDWSSDVCSSDLRFHGLPAQLARLADAGQLFDALAGDQLVHDAVLESQRRLGQAGAQRLVLVQDRKSVV